MVRSHDIDPAAGIQFRVFAILWAIAALFHMAHSSVFNTQLNFALLTLSALFVIFRPSLPSFLLLITLQLFDAIFRMPFTTNHWLFTAFVNLTILHAVVYLIIKGKTFRIGESDLFNTFSPVVRIEVIILYFFAVFHKLNYGFFSPETSCATELLKAQGVESFIRMDKTLYSANAYLTILIESAIPLLLYFRRTRNLGIFVGIFFHCVLSYSSYNAFYDFSSMIFAMYFLFASPQFSLQLYDLASRARNAIQSWLLHFDWKRFLILIGGFVVGLGLLYILNKKLTTFKSVNLYFFWTVYSVAYTWVFVRFWIRYRTREEYISYRFPHTAFWVIPLIVFVNGTSPYLGLKTENSYAMFSNLRTEAGSSNHFFVPANIQLFDYQKNVVQIIASSDEGLQRLANEKKALVLFEFNNYVMERRPENVEYILNGNRYTYSKSQKSADKNLQRNPYWLAKLMKFRPFAIAGEQPCGH
jgi:hypothetical protein